MNSSPEKRESIYVNHKPTAVEQFLVEYKDIEDKEIIADLQELWNSWHQENPSYQDAKKLTTRLMPVAEQIDEIIKRN